MPGRHHIHQVNDAGNTNQAALQERTAGRPVQTNDDGGAGALGLGTRGGDGLRLGQARLAQRPRQRRQELRLPGPQH